MASMWSCSGHRQVNHRTWPAKRAVGFPSSGHHRLLFKPSITHSWRWLTHYIDVIMTTMASQITSLAVVYSTVYSDADQRKHQSSASLAFVWGIHRDRWIPRTKGQLRGKCFHLMTSSCNKNTLSHQLAVWLEVGRSEPEGDETPGPDELGPLQIRGPRTAHMMGITVAGPLVEISSTCCTET